MIKSLFRSDERNHKRGFTLIEILIVIAIVSILAAVVIVAINPARQFRLANDTERRAEVNATLNAVYQYATDFRGLFPAGITGTQTEICATGAASCTGLTDLGTLRTANNIYITSLPADPLPVSARGDVNGDGGMVANNANGTGYTIRTVGTSPNLRIEVVARSTEEATPDIIVTR